MKKMKRGFGMATVLALFLAIGMIASPAAFSATAPSSGADELPGINVDDVEARLDCVISFLRGDPNGPQMEVTDNFKNVSGLMGKIKSGADDQGNIVTILDDPYKAQNEVIIGAVKDLLKKGASKQDTEILKGLLAYIDNVPDDYCDPEAYEVDPRVGVFAEGGEYEPFIPDPEEGWLYYGKPYDLEKIAEIAAVRSNNGILYFSDEELLELTFSGGWGYDVEQEPTAVAFRGPENLQFQGSLQLDMPAFIAPFLVLGYGGYGGGTVSGLDDVFEEGLEALVENPADGEYVVAERTVKYTPGDVFDFPTVEKSDRYYRFTWNMLQDHIGGPAVENNPTFSTTLYPDYSIMFDYDLRKDKGPGPSYPDHILGAMDDEGGTPGLAFVGLSPGGRLSLDFGYGGSESYESSFCDIGYTLSFEGKDEQPGPGMPRTIGALWHVDLSEEYGRPLPDFADADGNFAYMFIGEFFGPATGGLGVDALGSTSEGSRYNRFDLEDAFVIFRPYQTVVDGVMVERDYGDPNDIPDNFGAQGISPEYDFVAQGDLDWEYTPHKYTVTYGSHDAVVNIHSMDQANYEYMHDADLWDGMISRVDDYYGRYAVSLEEEDCFDELLGLEQKYEYTDTPVKHGEFKPGCFDENPLDDPGNPLAEWDIKWWSDEVLVNSEDYGKTSVDLGNNYEYGLQTVGYGGFLGSGAQCYTNHDTLNQINSSGFLAYSVQVEEDIVNREILNLQSVRSVADSVRSAQMSAGIRARDAWFVQQADAMSGRVTKDHNGNWVRAQQYVLRSDDNTSVQIVNANLRNESDMSTMVFTTDFASAYAGNLTELPWGDWLETRYDMSTDMRFVFTTDPEEYNHPDLLSMDVRFAHAGDSLQEARTFDERSYVEGTPFWMQEITGDQLTINDALNYNYTMLGGPMPEPLEPLGEGLYTINYYGSGFTYELGPNGGVEASCIDVSFYDAEDGERGLNTTRAGQTGGFSDIWDALRVDVPGSFGGTSVMGNLEIVINNSEEGHKFFTQPIDVVYIPMSRMLWKDDYNFSKNI